MSMNRLIVYGVAAAVGLGGHAHASLIANGGFETETPTGCQLPPSTSTTICNNPPPSWSANDGGAVDAVFPNSGFYDEALGNGSTGPGTLSQTVATTPGQTYLLSFAALDETPSPSDRLTVSFGGFSTTITGDTLASYVTESFTIRGANITAPATTLLFSASMLNSDFNIDNVALNPATTSLPEPRTAALLLGTLASLIGVRLWRRAA